MKKNGFGGILGRFAITNAFLFLLPMGLALGFYAVSANAILRAMDDLAMARLSSGMQSVERGFADARRAVASLAMDYQINLYLNKTGPLNGIETLELKSISAKIAPMVYGNGLIGHCFIYFKGSASVAYESGFSSYESFYGPIFGEEGYAAADWESAVMMRANSETLRTKAAISFEGRGLSTAMAIWPLGYGESRRGAMVAIIDAEALSGALEGLPSLYGGRGCVLDGRGEAIQFYGDGEVPEKALLGAYRERNGRNGLARTIRSGRRNYRLYRMESPSTGWTFVAALDEAGVLSGARRFRDLAIGLLAAGLLIGAASVLALAVFQARPVGRIFSLALERPIADGQLRGMQFRMAEDAILALRVSRDEYHSRAITAEGSARANFLRRLLEGSFSDREPLEREAAEAGAPLGDRQSYILLCGSRNPGTIPAEELEEFERAADKAVAGLLARGEYFVSLAPGEYAFIMGSGPSMRAEAARISDALAGSAPRGLRPSLVFAAGEPVADPRLLRASLLQANSAARLAEPGRVEPLFYQDAPKASVTIRYPMDVEESIMRAVRSANAVLLDTLVSSVAKANLDDCHLDRRDAEDLAASVRGTVVRLLPEFPAESAGLAEKLRAASLKTEPRESIEASRAVLGAMAEAAALRKRSRNRELADSARSFIERHYQSASLGLPVIASAHRISENYLSNLYKEQEGECISETIERVRMQAAKRLLEGSAESVDRIASKCGYSSGVSFRRAFKRSAGLSPSEYRASRPRSGSQPGAGGGAPGEAI